MSPEIRILTADDASAVSQLTAQAFNIAPEHSERRALRFQPERSLGAFEAGRLVAHLALHELGQWFGGAAVPMGAVAAVAVAPESRATGLTSRLLAVALHQMHNRGEVISTLYPATGVPYRRAGWEVAGSRLWRRVPLRSLALLPRPQTSTVVRRGDLGDTRPAEHVYQRVAPSVDGFLARNRRWWQRWSERLAEPDHGYLYLAERSGTPAGYLAYHHISGRDEEFYGLQVDELVAAEPDALLALLHLLASNRGMSRWASYHGSPEEPLNLLLPEQDTVIEADWRWMTRLVDLPGAVAARGFPPEVKATVHLEVVDREASWNAGRWVLEVSDGKGQLHAGGHGSVRAPVNALAPLYTGMSSPWTLTRLGLLEAPSAADLSALAVAFVGPSPWMVDFF